MGKAIDAKVLDVYFDEAKIHGLLHHATAALCKVMPSNPRAFLAEHFASTLATPDKGLQALEALETSGRKSIEEQAKVGREAYALCYKLLSMRPSKKVGPMRRSLQFDDIINSHPCNGPLGGMVRSPKSFTPFSGSGRSQSFFLGGSLSKSISTPQEHDLDPMFSFSDVSKEVTLSLADLRDHQPVVAPVLTDDEVQNYHRTLSLLSNVSNMRDALIFSSNLRWDHTLNRCVPGRVWKPNLPTHLRERLDRPLSPSEIQNIELECKCHTAPSAGPGKVPRVLYILGPAGAGKSTIRTQSENLLNIKLDDYVEVEGDTLRKHHKAWADLLQTVPGEGYKDSMKVVSKHVDAFKQTMLEKAIKERRNILISKTGQDSSKFKQEVQRMQETGYVVDAIGLVVGMKEAGHRAVNRAHENGRWHDPSFAKWANVMNSIQYLMDAQITDNCLVFDNQDFDRPVPIYTRTHNIAYVHGIMERYCTADGGEVDILHHPDA